MSTFNRNIIPVNPSAITTATIASPRTTANELPLSSTTATTGGDDYYARLVKLIPAEAVGLYLTLMNFILGSEGASPGKNTGLAWATFLVIGAILPFYLRRVLGVERKAQILWTTISYVVWAFASIGPFKDIKWPGGTTTAILSAIVLPIYMFILPVFYKPTSLNK